jgi:hypothetical protein
MRRATSAVVGPARPAAGLMPNLAWNFLMVAQSSSDWAPSAVTVPYAPISAREASTSRCRSPWAHPLAGWDGEDAAGDWAAGDWAAGVGEAGGVDGSTWSRVGPGDALSPVALGTATIRSR